MSLNINQDLDNALKYYPNLKKVYRDNHWKLYGEIFIKIPKTGEVIDTYNVEMTYPKNYPNNLPIVKELSGKIPITPDRHVYLSGKLCLMAPPEEILLCIKSKIDSLYFIRRILVPYLANQTLINAGLPGFLKGERSHDFSGIIEFWKDLCKTKDIEIVFNCMEIVFKKTVILTQSKCFCGSQKKYKHCHFNAIKDMKRYNSIYLASQYRDIKNWVSQIQK